jgi:hypothetical protein
MPTRNLSKTIQQHPIKYKKTNQGEFLHVGETTPLHRIPLENRIPLGASYDIGKLGSAHFRLEKNYEWRQSINVKNKNLELLLSQRKSGLYIAGIRSFFRGTAETLLRKLEVIAQYRKSEYIYFLTKNPKMEQLAEKMGYQLLGTDSITEDLYYVKLLR